MNEKQQPSGETPRTEADASTDTTADAARREVLKRLGVYGAYATPALLTALSSKASAQVVVESGGTGFRNERQTPGESEDERKARESRRDA